MLRTVISIFCVQVGQVGYSVIHCFFGLWGVGGCGAVREKFVTKAVDEKGIGWMCRELCM